MATASPSGEVAVWDLNRHRLSSVIRAAHDGAVTGLAYLPSQPLLLTSGPDNALKVEQSTAKCTGVASTIITQVCQCIKFCNSQVHQRDECCIIQMCQCNKHSNSNFSNISAPLL